jgi:hypothetical protein
MAGSRVSVAVLAALAFPLSGWAQEANNGWGGRAFVAINAGAQAQSPNFEYESSVIAWRETARAGLEIPGKTGAAFDIGGGVRLVENLGVGVTYSRYSKTRTGTLSTIIPDPWFRNAASEVHQQIPLQREENAIHIQAIYRIPVANNLQVGLFGGPTYFRCLDDVISQFALEGEILWPSLDWVVGFRGVTQTVDKDSVWGFHGGADVTYLLTKYFGVGTTVRFSRASHDAVNHFASTEYLTWQGDPRNEWRATTSWGGAESDSTVSMKHGGLQWTGGVSFRF